MKKFLRKCIRKLQKYCIDICPKCQTELKISIGFDKKAFKYCKKCGDMWI